ncbi:MAG: ParB N-terminal domain-containing protein [Gammaproteobacteria bacterium]|nr:ParB N-terminal domain-containing protein [Gammaproteobacteria bacterium]
MKYQRHPQSEIYPRMDESEYRALVESIRDQGFHADKPVVVYEEQIIDGWHRYNAALEAKVEPLIRQWEGKPDGLVPYVIASNSTRRHLSKAALAQSLIRADTLRSMTTEEIAKAAGVSRATVAEQHRLRELDPETADAVAEGREPAEAGKRRVLKQPEQKSGNLFVQLSQRLTKAVTAHAAERGITRKTYVNEAIEARVKEDAEKQQAAA